MPLQIDELQSTVILPVLAETVSFVTQAGAADAGEAAGIVVFGQLNNNKVLNLLGNQMGEKSGTGIASSIVFTTGVMDSALEIPWNSAANNTNAQIAAMIVTVNSGSNGTWACHYPSGLLIVKKKTTGTSQLITSYKVRSSNSSASSSSSSSSSSASIGGGNAIYSNTSGDFTATANSGAKTVTLSAYASTVLSATITASNFLNAVIKRKTSGGVVDTLPMTSIAFAANVLTLANMTANFAVGDTVQVFVSGPDKGFDETNDGHKMTVISRGAGERINNDWSEIVEAYTNMTMISTTTETVINAAATAVGYVNINNTLNGTVEIFDGTNSAGNRKLNLAAGTLPGSFPIKAKFGTSLRIKNSSASDYVTITWNTIVAES